MVQLSFLNFKIVCGCSGLKVKVALVAGVEMVCVSCMDQIAKGVQQVQISHLDLIHNDP